MREAAAVNAHTHLYSGLAPLGMPPPLQKPESFVEILERIWWRLDRALDADSLRAAARYYVAESLLAGTSVLIDHHESPSLIEGSLDILADVCEELGIRALLCYGATERNGGRHEGLQGVQECRRFIATRRSKLVRGAVGLHASFTVSDEIVAEAAAAARDLHTVVHVHVAEDRADLDDAQQRGYSGPLQRLLAFGALPQGSIVAHGVHLGETDIEALNKAGLWLVQNPRSNRGNGVGYPRAIHAAADVALGTDGFPAQMSDEVAALWEEALANGDASDLSPRIAGGQRLAAELFGKIDDHVIRHGGRVTSLVVAGREVVHNGQLLTGDIEEIRAHANEQAARLWKRMGV